MLVDDSTKYISNIDVELTSVPSGNIHIHTHTKGITNPPLP